MSGFYSLLFGLSLLTENKDIKCPKPDTLALRPMQVMQALEGMSLGGGVLVVNDRDPKELPDQLHSVLEGDPRFELWTWRRVKGLPHRDLPRINIKKAYGGGC